MKTFSLLIIALLGFSPVFGQSFLKTGVNLSRLYNGLFNPREEASPALTIGHQVYLLQAEDLKIVLGDCIDYKRLFYYYYNGGLGGGTSYSGYVHLVNLELDLRLRMGRKLFGEVGAFSSYALLKKYSNQKASFSQTCFLPPTGGVCPPVTYKPSPYVDDFKRFDFGVLLGIGYHLEKIILTFDYQLGVIPILDLGRNSTYATDQFNFSTVIPFSVLKKKASK